MVYQPPPVYGRREVLEDRIQGEVTRESGSIKLGFAGSSSKITMIVRYKLLTRIILSNCNLFGNSSGGHLLRMNLKPVEEIRTHYPHLCSRVAKSVVVSGLTQIFLRLTLLYLGLNL